MDDDEKGGVGRAAAGDGDLLARDEAATAAAACWRNRATSTAVAAAAGSSSALAAAPPPPDGGDLLARPRGGWPWLRRSGCGESEARDTLSFAPFGFPRRCSVSGVPEGAHDNNPSPYAEFDVFASRALSERPRDAAASELCAEGTLALEDRQQSTSSSAQTAAR